jgi:hypothetical protein
MLPAVAGLAALVFLVLFGLFFPRVVRVLVGLARRAASAVLAVGGRETGAGLREPLPLDVDRAFASAGGGGAVEVALPVLLGALGSRGGGWLVATPTHLGVVGRRLGRPRAMVAPMREVAAPAVSRGVLADSLRIATGRGVWRVTLLREPGRRPETVATRIAALAAAARSGPAAPAPLTAGAP